MEFSPSSIILVLLVGLTAHLWGGSVLLIIAIGVCAGYAMSIRVFQEEKPSASRPSKRPSSSLSVSDTASKPSIPSVTDLPPALRTPVSTTPSLQTPTISTSGPYSAAFSSLSPIPSKRRLILVAKNLPIQVRIPSDGSPPTVQWEDTRSFLSNLRSLQTSDREVFWVGLAQTEYLSPTVSAVEKSRYIDLCHSHSCYPVFVDYELYESYMNGFCKNVLWPLLHYSTQQAMSVGEQWPTIWNSYQRVNESIANEVTSLFSSPEDMAWIHNYFCFLVPSFIRLTQPRSRLGLFIHTTFPSSDIFRILPSRAHLLSSIMAVDLIGFQTFDYARHFLSCIKRVLDLEFETLPGGALGVRVHGRFVSILISHVGIQSASFREALNNERVIQAAKQLKSQYAGKQIIVGVDELDFIKGPQLKVQAYERFLRKYPDMAQKIVFIEVLQVSRNAVDQAAVRSSVLKEIEELRQKFGQSIIQVIEPTGQVELTDLVSLYNASSVAVITSLWDGLNLSPFEFTASQNPDSPGVLILSEFAGCSRSLSGVIRVNPWSLDSVADSIYTAVNMPVDERKANHLRRFNHVMTHNVDSWASGFLDNLEKAAKPTSQLNFIQTNQGNETVLMGLRGNFVHLDVANVKSHYSNAPQRLFFLDYDGTLTSSEKSDQQAKHTRPSKEVMAILKDLTADQKNCVFIMSGRGRATLDAWFREIPELGLAAEKGLFLKWPARFAQQCRKDRVAPREDESDDDDDEDNEQLVRIQRQMSRLIREENVKPQSDAEWEYMVNLDDVTWKSSALEIVRAYTEQTDGSWIEDKEFGIVWHYENVDPEYGRMQANDLQKHLIKVLSHPGVDVLKYNNSRILEVKPRGVSKGNAAIAICEALFVDGPFQFDVPSFFLCIGDDRADEEMFQAITQKGPWIEILATAGNGNAYGSANDPQSFHRLNLHATKVKQVKDRVDCGQGYLRDENLFTVTVGMKPSNAKFYLASHKEVIDTLKTMTI